MVVETFGTKAEKDATGQDSSEIVEPELVFAVPGEAKSVENVRSMVSDKGNHLVAAVLLSDTRKAFECLQKQHEHGRSCPPPYHTFGDAEPFEDEPLKEVGARLLVKTDFPPGRLHPGRMYLIHGHWCLEGRLALFCGLRVFEVSERGAREFLKNRIKTEGRETGG